MSTRDILVMIGQFFALYSAIYLAYLLVTIKRRKEYDAIKASKEIKYLVDMYKLDFKKISYKKFRRTLLSFNSLILALTLTVTNLFDKFYVKIGVAFILILPIILFGYKLIGESFKKRGEK